MNTRLSRERSVCAHRAPVIHVLFAASLPPLRQQRRRKMVDELVRSGRAVREKVDDSVRARPPWKEPPDRTVRAVVDCANRGRAREVREVRRRGAVQVSEMGAAPLSCGEQRERCDSAPAARKRACQVCRWLSSARRGRAQTSLTLAVPAAVAQGGAARPAGGSQSSPDIIASRYRRFLRV